MVSVALEKRVTISAHRTISNGICSLFLFPALAKPIPNHPLMYLVFSLQRVLCHGLSQLMRQPCNVIDLMSLLRQKRKLDHQTSTHTAVVHSSTIRKTWRSMVCMSSEFSCRFVSVKHLCGYAILAYYILCSTQCLILAFRRSFFVSVAKVKLATSWCMNMIYKLSFMKVSFVHTVFCKQAFAF